MYVVVVVLLQVLNSDLKLEAIVLEVSVWRRRGRLGHGVQVPLPILFQRVQQLLSIWMNQVGPRLPQRVDDVVDEAHLGKKKKMKILQIPDEGTLMCGAKGTCQHFGEYVDSLMVDLAEHKN